MEDLIYYRNYAINIAFKGESGLPRTAHYNCRKDHPDQPGPVEIVGVIDGYNDSLKDLHARTVTTAQSHIDASLAGSKTVFSKEILP